MQNPLSLSKVLLLLNIYRKTDSREVITDLPRLGTDCHILKRNLSRTNDPNERKGMVLQNDYDFDRKTHHTYKGATTTLDTINFVRRKCKLLGKRKIHSHTEYEKSALKIMLGA